MVSSCSSSNKIAGKTAGNDNAAKVACNGGGLLPDKKYQPWLPAALPVIMIKFPTTAEVETNAIEMRKYVMKIIL